MKIQKKIFIFFLGGGRGGGGVGSGGGVGLVGGGVTSPLRHRRLPEVVLCYLCIKALIRE